MKPTNCEKIIRITKLTSLENTVDISLSGNNLFWANDILTHNSGVSNSDPSMSDTAESMGLVHTSDLMLSIVSTEDLEQLKQVLFKQLKNRYNDIAVNKRFVVGLDKPKMKFYDVEPSAQQGITNPSSNNGPPSNIINSPNSANPSQIKDFGEWD